MKLDITAPVKDQIRSLKKEYDLAIKSGDFQKAKRCANKCVKLYILLAKNDPSSSDLYLKNSKIWEKEYNKKEEDLKKEISKNPNKKREKNEYDEDFSSIIYQMISKSSISWSNIGGLDEVKKLMLQTLYMWGVNKPDSIKPWRGVLLFGPPGTGKTLLAAASAGEANATFINLKANKVLSKYFGESSKIISKVFEIAKKKKPTIIFIDEFDSLSTNRESNGNEASRRVLSELLTNIDGFEDKDEDSSILTLAATNAPWDLDSAILSRFPRKIFVPLPDNESCKQIIKIKLHGLDQSNLDFNNLSDICVKKRYSGREIESLCNYAKNIMLNESNPELKNNKKLIESIKYFEKLKTKKLKTRPMKMNDFNEGFNKIKSSISKEQLERFKNWNEEFGE